VRRGKKRQAPAGSVPRAEDGRRDSTTSFRLKLSEALDPAQCGCVQLVTIGSASPFGRPGWRSSPPMSSGLRARAAAGEAASDATLFGVINPARAKNFATWDPDQAAHHVAETDSDCDDKQNLQRTGETVCTARGRGGRCARMRKGKPLVVWFPSTGCGSGSVW